MLLGSFHFKKNSLHLLSSSQFVQAIKNIKPQGELNLEFLQTWTLSKIFNTAENESNLSTVRFNEDEITNAVKLSSDGLTVRNDFPSFETVFANARLSSGKWYYEVCLGTDGKFQIGWASKNQSNPDPITGSGVGDDDFSYAIDLYEMKYWHSGAREIHSRKWRAGDVIGCYINLDAGSIFFSLNGVNLGPGFGNVHGKGLSPSLSLDGFQHCCVNFGYTPFRYPPEKGFFAVSRAGVDSQQLPYTQTEFIIGALTIFTVCAVAGLAWYFFKNRINK